MRKFALHGFWQMRSFRAASLKAAPAKEYRSMAYPGSHERKSESRLEAKMLRTSFSTW
jgi:hypothetical protein